MSNSLAIAAVTETLRQILYRGINASPQVDPTSDPELAGTDVTTCPPDKARGRLTGNQLIYSARWRSTRPGATSRRRIRSNPVRPVTAAAAQPDLPDHRFRIGRRRKLHLAHRLLGRAMSLLHARRC
jgi:hypothetical protein